MLKWQMKWQGLHQSNQDFWEWNERHLIAQKKGMSEWYLRYKTRVCKVERDYGYEATSAD